MTHFYELYPLFATTQLAIIMIVSVMNNHVHYASRPNLSERINTALYMLESKCVSWSTASSNVCITHMLKACDMAGLTMCLLYLKSSVVECTYMQFWTRKG